MTQILKIVWFVVEHPTIDGPYGAKGASDIAGIPKEPAITNAIFNTAEVRVDRLLVDQEYICNALNVVK